MSSEVATSVFRVAAHMFRRRRLILNLPHCRATSPHVAPLAKLGRLFRRVCYTLRDLFSGHLLPGDDIDIRFLERLSGSDVAGSLLRLVLVQCIQDGASELRVLRDNEADCVRFLYTVGPAEAGVGGRVPKQSTGPSGPRTNGRHEDGAALPERERTPGSPDVWAEITPVPSTIAPRLFGLIRRYSGVRHVPGQGILRYRFCGAEGFACVEWLSADRVVVRFSDTGSADVAR